MKRLRAEIVVMVDGTVWMCLMSLTFTIMNGYNDKYDNIYITTINIKNKLKILIQAFSAHQSNFNS